jgi:protein-L-isoaspartate(D-aspartate) O-methyltransferase
MTEALGLTGKERVLEVGSGSGYQSAVLSLLCDKVYAIERISILASRAMRVLDDLHCSNVIIRVGDGTLGWAEEAPFDAIIVAAGSPSVPPAYIEQLSEGGRLVMPVGDEDWQKLVRITKRAGSTSTEVFGECRFVKLVGRYGWQMEKKESG